MKALANCDHVSVGSISSVRLRIPGHLGMHSFGTHTAFPKPITDPRLLTTDC